MTSNEKTVYLDGNVLLAASTLEDKLHDETIEFLDLVRQADWKLIIGTPILLELEQLLYLGDMGWFRLRHALATLPKYEVKVVEDDHRRVLELANLYLEEKVLSERYFANLLILASATLADADYVVSWDSRRMANKSVVSAVNRVNVNRKLREIEVVTPKRLSQIIKEEVL
ncbi:MAG: type II toxin-antitoxin system VapC family toxin [Crenarchaeota archaeon]|nr:type II toxin-antitoxin system VapC family toxin [Thermoproteota archaeon]